jgi:preprotein translocase subunit SecY
MTEPPPLLENDSELLVDDDPMAPAWRQALVAAVIARRAPLAWSVGVLAIIQVAARILLPGMSAEAVAGVLSGSGFDVGAGAYLLPIGTVERLSIQALGLGPYLYATATVQAIAYLWQLLGDGDGPRPWRLRAAGGLALVIAARQAMGLARDLVEGAAQFPSGLPVIARPDWLFSVTTVLTLVAATACWIWLTDHMTRRGVANGIRLTVLVGVVSNVISVLLALPVSSVLRLPLVVLSPSSVFELVLAFAVAPAYRRTVTAVDRAGAQPPSDDVHTEPSDSAGP